MSFALIPSGGSVGADSKLPAPENLRVRIVGTASFQDRTTALIEDLNNQTESFYRIGDPIYGYHITAITSDGISVEKSGKRYYMPFEPASFRSEPADSGQKPVVANNYLDTPRRRTSPNYYLPPSASTQWDLWTLNANVPTSPVKADLGGRFAFPLSSFKRLSSSFGYRRHPIRGGTKMHQGIDLAANTGTRIFAADSGTVTRSGWLGGYGYCIMIDHHNGFVSVYGHCSKLIADVGDNVRRGDYVAQVGSTGASTGPHLHFEVRKNGNPVDPAQFFKGRL